MKARRVVKKPATRRRLTSMRVSAGFRAFVLDQLSLVPRLRAKDMFGGVGLYADDVFFGIIAADVLYFKVGDANRAAYEAAGSAPFRPYADRAMTMPYHAVPVEILEAAPTLAAWAQAAVAVANASRKTRKSAPARNSRRPGKRGKP